MEQLQNTLETAHRKRVSDGVWAAADAAHYVLNCFRNSVNHEALTMSGGAEPYFIFDPRCLPSLGPEATFEVKDWERHSEYVLNIIRESTGLDVKWLGGRIMLERRLPPKTSYAARKGLPCEPAWAACSSEWVARGPPRYSMVGGGNNDAYSMVCGGNKDAPGVVVDRCAIPIAPCPGPTAEFDKCPVIATVLKGASALKPAAAPASAYEEEPYTGGNDYGIEILETEKKPEGPKQT
jgi:hypothetical protein